MSHSISTLFDFITDYVASNYSLRPDTIASMEPKIRLAIVELQKNNLFPETTIEFTSLDMKDEKRDGSGELIFNYYTLPEDFRQLYNKGPAFEVEGKSDVYSYRDYPTFLRIRNSSSKPIFTIQQYNGDHGKRNRLIVDPFPDDTDIVYITYYSNGIGLNIEDVDQQYYMAVINHVLMQLNIRSKEFYMDDVVDVKRNRDNLAGQGSHHGSFAQTKPRFFGNHRSRGKRQDSRINTKEEL